MTLNEMFNVSKDNDLKQTSFKQKGTMAQNEYWTYEEINPNGEIISKIEHWECTSIKPPYNSNSGYIKYDINGNIIEKKNF
jgi:hypothetical protein